MEPGRRTGENRRSPARPPLPRSSWGGSGFGEHVARGRRTGSVQRPDDSSPSATAARSAGCGSGHAARAGPRRPAGPGPPGWGTRTVTRRRPSSATQPSSRRSRRTEGRLRRLERGAHALRGHVSLPDAAGSRRRRGGCAWPNWRPRVSRHPLGSLPGALGDACRAHPASCPAASGWLRLAELRVAPTSRALTVSGDDNPARAPVTGELPQILIGAYRRRWLAQGRASGGDPSGPTGHRPPTRMARPARLGPGPRSPRAPRSLLKGGPKPDPPVVPPWVARRGLLTFRNLCT